MSAGLATVARTPSATRASREDIVLPLSCWCSGRMRSAKAQRNEHAEDGRHGQRGKHEAVIGHAGDSAGEQVVLR